MEKYVIFDINNEKSVKAYTNNSVRLAVENKQRIIEELVRLKDNIDVEEESMEVMFSFLLNETDSIVLKLSKYDTLSVLMSLSEAGYTSDEIKEAIQKLLDDEMDGDEFYALLARFNRMLARTLPLKTFISLQDAFRSAGESIADLLSEECKESLLSSN